MSAEVLAGQKWLNSTYGGRSGYQSVEETGLPGSATSAALVSALQIELGMDTVTGVFGEQTEVACNANRMHPADTGNKVKIIQYGLYAKGYDPNGVTGIYNGATGIAVRDLVADAGVTILADASIGAMEMKAVLGVDEYKLIAGGDATVRAIQQDLNSRYRSYTGLCACDGYYGRSTNSAIIYAIQAEEGMSTDMATGFFGPSTKNYLPDLWQSGQWGMDGGYTDAQIANFTKLAQYALYCVGVDRYNGGTGSKYNPGSMDGSQSASTLAALHAFQNDHALTQRDMVGLDEWMGLLVSTGNPNRDGIACDCSTQLTTSSLVASLYSDDYRIVGRYLTGTVGGGSSKRAKNLTSSEIQTIFAGGMSIFCIFQDDADWWQDHDDLSDYFGYDRGYSDAKKAIQAASNLGVPAGEYIYFAVDFDYMEGEVWNKVVPHFQGINAQMTENGNPYRIGIYSARNTCGIVSAEGLASSSFVSDMSTGYSGNLGYPMPSNWAFDQIQEYTNSAGFGVDKNVASKRYMGFSTLTASSSYSKPYKNLPDSSTPLMTGLVARIEALENLYHSYYLEKFSDSLAGIGLASAVTNFLRHPKYNDDGYFVSHDSKIPQWTISLGATIDYAFVNYVKENDPSLYSFFMGFLPADDQYYTDPSRLSSIDVCHLMATVEGYVVAGPIVPDYWTGWGGDLASGFAQVKAWMDEGEHVGWTLDEEADYAIGAPESPCNFSDFCCDSDAIAIAAHIRNNLSGSSHSLSEAIAWYYAGPYLSRFQYLRDDVASGVNDVDALAAKTYDRTHGVLETVGGVGLIAQLAGGAGTDIQRACCRAFANYIISEL